MRTWRHRAHREVKLLGLAPVKRAGRKVGTAARHFGITLYGPLRPARRAKRRIRRR